MFVHPDLGTSGASEQLTVAKTHMLLMLNLITIEIMKLETNGAIMLMTE